ncbi:MAG TPA: hypothetical protein VGQ41_14300 [Pyrinomonadaceae bacterium]|nr:hypothetical protein [Pyrinomonadaceae bacterium]
MPNAGDLAKYLVVTDSVNNSIRPKDNLANAIVPVFGNDAA